MENAAAEVLANAKPLAGKQTEAYDPMEKIPTVGTSDLTAGVVLAGTYVETQKIMSHKFRSQEIDQESGMPIQYLHVFTNNNKKFGLWAVAFTRLALKNVIPGTYVELTYKGKDADGRHDFTFKKGV